MIQSETDYLDREFTVSENVPSTVSELVELIGEQAVLDEAVGNLYYRNKYPRVYRKVSAAVAEAGFPVAVTDTKELKDGTKRDIKEAPMDHIRRFLAADPANRAKLQELFESIGNSEPLYVKGERTAGSGKVAKRDIETANGIFAAGDEKVEAVIEKIEKFTGYKVTRDADGAATPESLGKGISVLTKHLQQQAMKDALA